MIDIYSMSAGIWKSIRSAALGSYSAADAPEEALLACEHAMACLAAAAAHSVLGPLAGFGAATSLKQFRIDLSSTLPNDWHLAAVKVPPEVTGEFLRLVAQMHRERFSISTYYESLLEWDWRSGIAGDQDRRRTMGAFHTPQEVAELALNRLARNIIDAQFGPRTESFGRKEYDYLSSLKVADMAVGAGRFPVAWLRMFDRDSTFTQEEREEWMIRSFRNLELTDVDRPALELSVVACSAAIGVKALPLMSELHMRLGNALIDRPKGEIDGVSMLAMGHIWHPSAGVLGPSPDVDVVIGNPPWERVRYEGLQLLRGFDQRDDSPSAPEPLVSFAKTRKMSTELGVARMRADNRLSHSTHGEIYTHVAFTEMAMERTAKARGWVCHIVKSTMLNSPGHSRFISDLLRNDSLAEVWDFKNSRRIFPIDTRERFAVLIASASWGKDPRVVFGLTNVEDLREPSLLTPLPEDTRKMLSPKLGILPACSGRDLETLIDLSRLPTFREVFTQVNFGRLLHLTNHVGAIHKSGAPGRVPVWEGRMIEQFTSKFSTWAGVPPYKRWNPKTKARIVDENDRSDRYFVPESRWWVDDAKWDEVSARHQEQYSVGWRNASAPTNRRTVLASVLRGKPTIQSIQILQLPSPSDLMLVVGLMNSIPFDWLVRRRMAGIDVTSTLIAGTPVPSADRWDASVLFMGEQGSARDHANNIVAKLLSESAENDELVKSVGLKVAEPATAKERWALQRKLDVLVAWAYGLTLAELCDFLLDFPGEMDKTDVAELASGRFGNLDDQL